MARAHRIQARLIQNTKLTVHDIAREEHVSAAYLYTLLRLPWLAPDITTAIINYRHGQFPVLPVLFIGALIIIAGDIILSRRGTPWNAPHSGRCHPPARNLHDEGTWRSARWGASSSRSRTPAPPRSPATRITVDAKANLKNETTVHRLAGLDPGESRVVPSRSSPVQGDVRDEGGRGVPGLGPEAQPRVCRAREGEVGDNSFFWFFIITVP